MGGPAFKGRINQSDRAGGIVESTYEATQELLGVSMRVVLTAILIPTDSGTKVRMSGQKGGEVRGVMPGGFTAAPEAVRKDNMPKLWAIFERVAAALPPRP